MFVVALRLILGSKRDGDQVVDIASHSLIYF